MSWEKLLVAAGVLAALVVLVALLWPLLKHRAIYPGGVLTEAMSRPSMHGLSDGEEVWLEAEDGVRIHAWWTPARDSHGDSSAPRPRDGARAADDRPEADRQEDARTPGAVIYAHGNAETMATRAWIARRLSRLDLDALMFDYRGYGLSEGRASEEGLARDARAAWRHVVEERGVAPHRVVLMGHSLGSAVATRLALEVQRGEVQRGEVQRSELESGDDGPAALVVGSPFPDMPTLFRHHAPWLPEFLLRWRTNTLDAGSRLGQVDAPVLVLIGTEDETIPPGISRRVVEDARGTRTIRVESVPADHASLMADDRVWHALEDFLAGSSTGGPGQRAP